MALTLEVEQKLQKVSLIKLFGNDHDTWAEIAKGAYDYIKGYYPDGSEIRPDDVRGPLETVLRVNGDLQDYLSKKKLTQKYWFGHFTDLIIDRTWDHVIQDGDKDGE